MNFKKIISSVLIILIILSINLISFAATPEEMMREKPLATSQQTLTADKISGLTGEDSELSTKISSNAGGIIGIIRLVGIVAAVILLIMLAIKYVSAAPSEKAEIKKSAIIYITGAIILFATSGILTIIQTFSGKFAA